MGIMEEDINEKFNSLTNFNPKNKEIFKLFFKRFNDNINNLFELWFIEEYKKHSEYESIEYIVEEFYNFIVKKLTNQSITLSIKNTNNLNYSNTDYNISEIFNFPFMFFELRENSKLTGEQLKKLTNLEKEENILALSKEIFELIPGTDKSNNNKTKYKDAITNLDTINNNSSSSSVPELHGKEILENMNKYIRYRILTIFARNADKELINHLSNINISNIVDFISQENKTVYVNHQWDDEKKFESVLTYNKKYKNLIKNIYDIVDTLIKNKPKDETNFKNKYLKDKQFELESLIKKVDEEDKYYFENQLDELNDKITKLTLGNDDQYPF